jgi:hypothetical protein
LATSSIVEAKQYFSMNRINRGRRRLKQYFSKKRITGNRRLGISPAEADMVWTNVQKVPAFKKWARGVLMSYNKESTNSQNTWTTLYDRGVKETKQWLCLKWRVIQDRQFKEIGYTVLVNEAYLKYKSDDNISAYYACYGNK